MLRRRRPRFARGTARAAGSGNDGEDQMRSGLGPGGEWDRSLASNATAARATRVAGATHAAAAPGDAGITGPDAERAGSSPAADAMQHPGAPAVHPFLQQACASRGPGSPVPGMKQSPRVTPDRDRTTATIRARRAAARAIFPVTSP